MGQLIFLPISQSGSWINRYSNSIGNSAAELYFLSLLEILESQTEPQRHKESSQGHKTFNFKLGYEQFY